MDEKIKGIIDLAASGKIGQEEAASQLRRAFAASSVRDLGYANVDLQRKDRQGVSEIIYGEGKTPPQIAGIASALIEDESRVVITRLSRHKADEVARLLKEAGAISDKCELAYSEDARMGYIGGLPAPDGIGYILVACAGTSDIPVAEEAALTAQLLGNDVKRVFDIGVAGLHRTLAHGDDIAHASVIVAVAGMEGALASVIGGLARCPVIAVPTSVGYGAAFGGLSALLSMLNSCASGVTVVNIDNGFGAGFAASRMNHVGKREDGIL